MAAEPPDRLRVHVVADDPVARATLERTLRDAELIVARSTSVTGFSEPSAERVDLVAWDLGPQHSHTIEPLVQERGRDVPVVALVADDIGSPPGVNGIVYRDADSVRLAAALRAVAEGFVVREPTVRDDRAREPDDLTPREHEVLTLLVEGLSNKLIAARLAISEHTAKFHVNAVMQKLGAATRTEAVVRAVRGGLVTL